MSDIALRVESLSKMYKIGALQQRHSYQTLREAIVEFASMPFKRFRRDTAAEHLWALKDVSFEVKHGEVVGIIGRNGAGKSTLLKILSRITKPTSGRADIYGRVGSLLEVGTGFHPELTGRENIYMNGAILGMTRREIERKFDEIVAFSEIEQFLDTPVKRYSSGMSVRLAFAVAAHLEPEILVVDEVLAVGDAEFQKKCLGKMNDVSKTGRTILFVSHNMSAVNNLCQRGIVLEKGALALQGTTGEAVRYYLENSLGDENTDRTSGFINFSADSQKPIQVRKITLTNAQAEVKGLFDFQEAPCVNVDFEIRTPRLDYYVALVVIDMYGNWVFFSANDDLRESDLAGLQEGTYRYQIKLPNKLLKPGTYYLTLSLTGGKSGAGPYDRHDQVLSFAIADQFTRRGEKNAYRRPAIVAPEVEWTLLPVSK